MLAENVRVNVFGKVGKGFFSAYVSGNSFSNKSAYLVTRKDTLTVWLLPLPNLRDSRAINS